MSDSQRDDAPEASIDVRRRAPEAATTDFPSTPLELFRSTMLPAGVEVTTRVRNNAVVVEASPRAGGRVFDPPGAEAETPDLTKTQSSATVEVQDGSGYRPVHLPLMYAPTSTERPTPIARREGYGIPNHVFPPDSRAVFKDTAYPWSTVGRVDTANGFCTGTMVGRRLMLTASHCIQWTATGTGWIKFTPAYYNGSAPFGTAWATKVISWMQVDGSDGVSDLETAFDYVVVVLDGNIGDLTGYAGYRTYSSSWNNGNYWDQIGYPGDLTGGQRPAFFDNGAITSVGSQSTSGQQGYVLGNFLDTSGGHSGGPYWGWWASETFPRIVGTDSTSPSTPGSGTSGDNEAGGGPALSSLIDYARQNYP